MTRLAYLHELGVLANLRSRYDINEIYVSTFFFYKWFLFLFLWHTDRLIVVGWTSSLSCLVSHMVKVKLIH